MKKVSFSFILLLASLMALKAQNTLRSDARAAIVTESASTISDAHNNVPQVNQPPGAVTSISQLYRSNVYPVPSTGNCTLTIAAEAPSNIKLELVDEAGRVVWQNNETVTTGNNSYNYSFANQSPGIYLLRIKGNNINETKRLVITG